MTRGKGEGEQDARTWLVRARRITIGKAVLLEKSPTTKQSATEHSRTEQSTSQNPTIQYVTSPVCRGHAPRPDDEPDDQPLHWPEENTYNTTIRE